jgi:phosphonate transport system substrate-binding protein
MADAKRVLRVASCMAPNADGMCRGIAAYLAARLGLGVAIQEDVDWAGRARLLDLGEIDLCWICGLYYVDRVVLGQHIETCVAPVMRSPRYEGQAVYFSDVVVRNYSRYARFSDLKGEPFAYNEPHSHSGYGVLGYHLALQGETFDYFGAMVEAGAHQASLELLRSGQVEAAAIDSTVLEAEMRRDPSLARAVRVIEVLGPSPAPPWVVSKSLPQTLRLEIAQCLSEMHDDSEGAQVLGSWGVAELRRVSDSHYEPIREMARVAGAARASHWRQQPPGQPER